MSRGFTARQTAYLREGARRYADEAIDAVAASGRCDLVHAVAAPVPVRIVADLLGLDAHDLFARWTRAVEHMVAGVVSHPDEDAEAVAAFEAYIRDVVVRRTRDPGDDLISTMIRARGEGVFESFERETFPGVPPGDGVMGFISFLVLAGSETTRHAIALGMLALMEHPDQRQRLRDDPSLIADAAEEILRVSSPVRTMQRTVMADTELGGRQLRAGDLVVLAYGSANHDEAVFDEPDRFRIDRRPNDHVSFGFGSHFCLGANVARLEIAEVVGALVERLPDLALDPAAPVVRLRSPILNGLTRLPVVFTPTA